MNDVFSFLSLAFDEVLIAFDPEKLGLAIDGAKGQVHILGVFVPAFRDDRNAREMKTVFASAKRRKRKGRFVRERERGGERLVIESV